MTLRNVLSEEDRLLIVAAATSGGIQHSGWDENPFDPEYAHCGIPALIVDGWWWNPLLNSHDALALAVKLKLKVDFSQFATDDALSAAKRAIVQAAAALP